MADFMPTSASAVAVDELMPGDVLDLEGDEIADADGRGRYAYEFVTVESVERETPECVLVHFEDSVSVGFPPGHLVWRVGQMVEVEDDG